MAYHVVTGPQAFKTRLERVTFFWTFGRYSITSESVEGPNGSDTENERSKPVTWTNTFFIAVKYQSTSYELQIYDRQASCAAAN